MYLKNNSLAQTDQDNSSTCEDSDMASSGSTQSLGYNPILYCHCGLIAPMRTSWTDDNPGRRFYGCARYRYFVEARAIAIRQVRKEDLRHVAKATSATTVSTLFADMEGEETFDSSFLGYADEVAEELIADDDVIMIKGTKTTSAVSLILRGANDYMLDEMERALHDALSIVKRTLESNMVLSVNAAKDATELVAKLRAYHHAAETKADKQHLLSMGLDLSKGAIRNNLEVGVIEPAMSKVKIIQFATEAAITILRIDDMINLVKDESQNEED